jgi:hypothetical protein
VETGFERDELIRRGFESGFERAFTFGIEARFPEVEETFAAVRDVLAERPEISERSVVLFAEHAGIAAAARQQYGEPSLTASAIREYLDHSAAFFNSFFHP